MIQSNTYFRTLSFDYCRWCWVLSLPLHWKSPTSMKELDAEAPMWSPETTPALHIRGQNHLPHSSDPFILFVPLNQHHKECASYSFCCSFIILSSPRNLVFLHLSLQGPLYGFLFFCTCINSCKPLKNPKGAKCFLHVQANAPLMFNSMRMRLEAEHM